MRHAVGERGHAHRGQGALHAPVHLVPGQAHVERPERHVVEDGGAEELVVRVLEHEANLGADAADGVLADRHPGDPHRAVLGPERAVELEHQRALAGAVRADQGHLLAGRDPEVDAAQGLEAVRVSEVDVLELDGAPGVRAWRTLPRPSGLGRMGMRMGVRPRVIVQVHVLVHLEVGGLGGHRRGSHRIAMTS